MTDRIETADIREWQPVLRPDSATRLIDAVEDGKIVYLPQLRFALSDSELRFLDPATLGDKAKSLAFDPASGTLKHARADHAEIAAMMRRYAGVAHGLMCSLLPRYASALAAPPALPKTTRCCTSMPFPLHRLAIAVSCACSAM